MEENLNILLSKHNLGQYGILSLAYMGDAVIEIFAREHVLCDPNNAKPGALVYASKNFVTCEAQSTAVENILSILTDDELAVFKRGRNAKTHFTPKHGKLIQYRRATGFEALIGYLWLTEQHLRAKELFITAFKINDNLTTNED